MPASVYSSIFWYKKRGVGRVVIGLATFKSNTDSDLSDPAVMALYE